MAYCMYTTELFG